MAKRSSSSSTTTSISEDNPITRYFKETRAELRKVAWPTWEETKNLTMIIVAATVAMALFLGALDLLFERIVANIILGNLVWIGIAVVLFGAGFAAFYYNGQQE